MWRAVIFEGDMDIIDILHRWDQVLTLFLNRLHNPASDCFMVFMSEKKVWFVLYVLIALFMVRRLGWKRGLVGIASLALTLLLCDQMSGLLKYSVARLRPCYSTFMIREGIHVLENRGSFFGFFSAHAANAFGLAMCSTLIFKYDRTHTYKGYVKLIFIWASVLSISRIFVGKHYFGDIAVGAMIGTALGAAVAYLARRIFAKYMDRNVQTEKI